MKTIDQFIQFLRGEKGLYYFKMFTKHSVGHTEVECVLNDIAIHGLESELRCLEHLWKAFRNGETNVNAAMWKPRKYKVPIISVTMKEVLENHSC